MIRKSWIVFLFALILSIESIIIEYLTRLLGISPLSISAFSIAISGTLLLLISTLVTKKQFSILYSWKKFIPASIFLSIGIFTWYDAVSRVGASKESLLAGPIEIIAILFLARLFLHERLNKIQFAGVGIALAGFVVVLLSDNSVVDTNIVSPIFSVNYPLLQFTVEFGDIEAVISAISFALAVFFLTKLSSRYSPIEISGMCLVMSGSILVTVMILLSPDLSFQLLLSYWYIFLIFSLLPLIGTICYVEGLKRIGASLTSTIASSRILLTLIIQLILTRLAIQNTLPDDIILALFGGILGLCGIIIIHMHLYIKKQITKNNFKVK
ncbi:MAG: DMT family transporter [Nitrososphaeraceae archaeon]